MLVAILHQRGEEDCMMPGAEPIAWARAGVLAMSGELGIGLTWAGTLALLVSPAVLELPEELMREILATLGDMLTWILPAKILLTEWRGQPWSLVGKDCKGRG